MQVDIQVLLSMLEYRRPEFSASEEEFIDRFILSLPNAIKDAFGNVIVDVGNCPVIFSAHTDTVDSEDGMRDLIHCNETDVIYSPNGILGADDGAGCYIMCEMIMLGIHGRYIFHRAEEKFAGGAHWILNNTPEMLNGIKAAIAFDRMGDSDVITHMVTGRTCHESFALELCRLLSRTHMPAHGSYTDTGFYNQMIPNCTNISVGYYNQHTNYEFLDLKAFSEVVDRVCNINWTNLIGA